MLLLSASNIATMLPVTVLTAPSRREVYLPWTPCFAIRVDQASTASVYCVHQYCDFHPLYGSSRQKLSRFTHV